ncbi:MAG: hypothetical protein KKD18_04925 [Nanoarchaeota archaeon]|nr:hypothetical protein [Nanoarchaeota archaeon]MBU0977734.1 hypothetical protein [Nanoarchaeota archaeon]
MTPEQPQKPEKYLEGEIVSRNGTHVIIKYARPVRVPYAGAKRRISTMKVPYEALIPYEEANDQFHAPVRVLAPHIRKHLEGLVDNAIAGMLKAWDEADEMQDEAEMGNKERTAGPRTFTLGDIVGNNKEEGSKED